MAGKTKQNVSRRGHRGGESLVFFSGFNISLHDQNDAVGVFPSPGHCERQQCPASPPVGRGDPNWRSSNRDPNASSMKFLLPLGERVRVRGTANSTALFRIKDGITRIINSEATAPTSRGRGTSGQNSSVPLRTLREKS
jgi:hypothetical protein